MKFADAKIGNLIIFQSSCRPLNSNDIYYILKVDQNNIKVSSNNTIYNCNPDTFESDYWICISYEKN